LAILSCCLAPVPAVVVGATETTACAAVTDGVCAKT